MQESISAYEIHEWLAFYTIEAEDEHAAFEAAKRGNVDAGDEEVD
jgi:hypothetical protein